MNTFRDLLNTFDIQYIHKQKECDERLKNHIKENKCSDMIIDYLLMSREHGRKQREKLMTTYFYNIPKVLNKINEENKMIVDELEYILGNDFCKSIQHSIIFLPFK